VERKCAQGKQAQAQVDGGRVQRISGGVEVHAEIFLGVELARLKHKSLRQLSVNTPIAVLIGLRQSGTPNGRTKAHGVELGGLRVETCFDVAQTLAIGQLGKSHGTKLFGATEVAHPAVAAIAGYAAGKRSPGKEFHQLREQHLANVHRRLQKTSLESASRQSQIDTTQKRPQPLAHQAVADSELVVNRTAVTICLRTSCPCGANSLAIRENLLLAIAAERVTIAG